MKKFIFVFLLALSAVTVSPAVAQNLQDATVTNYRDELNRIKLLPGASEVTAQIDQTEAWLDQAANASQTGDRETSQTLLKRVRFSLMMLDALVSTQKLQQALEEQRLVADELPKKIQALKREIADLKHEREQLEKELAIARKF